MNKLDEILRKLLGHDDPVEIGNGYHDDCAEEIAEAKQAIVEAVGGLIGDDEPQPLGEGWDVAYVKGKNNLRKELRQTIKEWQ